MKPTPEKPSTTHLARAHLAVSISRGLTLNDLNKIAANIEAMGNGLEVRRFCGLTHSDESGNLTTDGHEAVGEITASFGDGLPPVAIPVCAECLEKISIEHHLSIGHDV
jgi:hypothetical protein